MRSFIRLSSLFTQHPSNYLICETSPYKDCTFNQYKSPILFSATEFQSCTFTSMTSNDCGAAISFISGGSLSMERSTFRECHTSKDFTDMKGGGAIFITCGTFYVTSSVFIDCVTKSYGGAIYAKEACTSSVLSITSFISCNALYGGGVMTHVGPTSTVSSCCYISCKVSNCGGGLYHNSNKPSSRISLSNSLFTDNIAKYSGQRGGGAFEDYGDSSYQSTYSFSYFANNTAQNGVGNDISLIQKLLPISNITHCFSTTSSDSLWNGGYHVNNWLHKLILSVIF